MVYNVHCTVRGFIIGHLQGWKFAHGFSEGIAGFLQKREQKSDSLKKMSNSLICLFLVSNLSDSLTSLIFGERPERFAHIAHFW